MASFDERLIMDVETADTIGDGPKRGLMVVLAVLTTIFLALLFHPEKPSPFTEHGAFGAGYGSSSIMFGANPRACAPRLR
jgi:hypothetical protein